MPQSFFTRLQETIKIDDENSITIEAPTYGQVQAANSKLMNFDVDEKGKQLGVNFDMAAMEIELVVVCIKSWEGPGFEGRPVTRENILALPAFVMDKVRPSIDRFTKGISEGEKKV